MRSSVHCDQSHPVLLSSLSLAAQLSGQVAEGRGKGVDAGGGTQQLLLSAALHRAVALVSLVAHRTGRELTASKPADLLAVGHSKEITIEVNK